MLQILHGALKQYKCNLFNIERKLRKATKHKQLLLNYKKSKKYPKCMMLRFHLSLHNYDNKLKDVCSKIFIRRQLIYVMKSLKLLRQKFELLKQNVTIIIITSKKKLPVKITNLLRK